MGNKSLICSSGIVSLSQRDKKTSMGYFNVSRTLTTRKSLIIV